MNSQPFVTPTRRLYLLLTGPQWGLAFTVGALLAAGSWQWYSFISIWIGVTLFLVGLIATHLHYAARFLVPFPHFAVLVVCLQYILAAWFALYHPTNDPVHFMGDRIGEYYAFAGQAVVLTAVCWFASLIRLPLQRLGQAHLTDPSPGLLVEIDVIGLVGVVGLILGNLVKVPALAFVFVLFSNLRFLSVFARMLLAAPGWSWRVALVLGLEIMFAAESAMFHNLLLWSLWTFGIWLYRFRPRLQTTLAALLLALLLLPALQEAKWQLRYSTSDDAEIFEDTVNPSIFDKTIRWIRFLPPSFYETITGKLDEGFLSEMGARYNQGWILNRVMQWVPLREPFAAGETIYGALEAAALPRLIASKKATSGGQENMARFAGLELVENTSMNLGFAGEMYANFGMVGGVIGCGVYALCFGAFFRLICRLASRNALWWATVPYVFYAAIKAEDDIAYVLNWTAKSAMVLIAVTLLMPNWRRALFPGKPVPTMDAIKAHF
ncbi:MAG: hypothetical protein QOF24_422 [Verrucomicrobiota bacterium]|jgi:uncharacterized membrane protein